MVSAIATLIIKALECYFGPEVVFITAFIIVLIAGLLAGIKTIIS
jgi:hypothetical protein